MSSIRDTFALLSSIARRSSTSISRSVSTSVRACFTSSHFATTCKQGHPIPAADSPQGPIYKPLAEGHSTVLHSSGPLPLPHGGRGEG